MHAHKPHCNLPCIRGGVVVHATINPSMQHVQNSYCTLDLLLLAQLQGVQEILCKSAAAKPNAAATLKHHSAAFSAANAVPASTHTCIHNKHELKQLQPSIFNRLAANTALSKPLSMERITALLNQQWYLVSYRMR
jgi:hypothetical protein